MTQFSPNTFVDITNQLEKKIDAVNAYASELRKKPHPRSVEGVRTLAALRGMQVMRTYAEGFIQVRGII